MLTHAAHEIREPLRETESPTSMPVKLASLGVAEDFAVKEREHRETDAQDGSIENSTWKSSRMTPREDYFDRHPPFGVILLKWLTRTAGGLGRGGV